MTTTTATDKDLLSDIISAGSAIARKAYSEGGAAEGKATAIYHYGNLVMGNTSLDEITELVAYAMTAASHPSSRRIQEFGSAYVATMTALVTL